MKTARPPQPAPPALASSGFFVLRTPLLPFDELLRFFSGMEAPAAGPDELEAALACDRARLRARLAALLARTEVREALFLASPSLDDSLDVWQHEPESERGQRVERTLLRYFARMCGRATPFGLFAGCSVGTIADQTDFVIADRAAYQRHTRLDGDYLGTLTEKLGQEPALRDHLVYRPNSSLYPFATRVRYAEARLADRTRSYHLVAAEATPYLLQTLARAARGARPAELVRALLDGDAGVTPEEAWAYIHELIAGQILVSDLAPAVTGPEPIFDLCTQLRELSDPTQGASVLEQTRATLADLDAAGVGVAPERYRAIARDLDVLPAQVELSRLFQVDLVKPAPGATLGHDVLGEILRGVEVLHRIGAEPLLPTSRNSLARFCAAFRARYEDREVPLCEVLDEESGIGFAASNAPGAEAAPLLGGLDFPESVAEESVPWGKRHDFLLGKLHEALCGGAQGSEIALGPDDLKQLEVADPLPLPDSLAVTGTLLAAGGAALGRGDYRVILGGVSGPSGASLLGRFCHGDPALTQLVKDHLRAEEALRPDAIFTEVVHLPEGRIGNILLRPLLREHELPYLGRSGVPLDKQIPLTDLRVSLLGERVVLRSARLQREIVPRLTTAHNFSSPRNLGVYRFLCALQGQGTSHGLSFRWGPLGGAPFLPRVVCGKLILALATWQLLAGQLKPLGDLRGAARFAAVQQLRAELRLPRLVAVVDGDNLLPLDLDNVLSVETFVHLLKERPRATLTEVPAGAEEPCAHGPEGRFVHEFVVPLLRVREPVRAASQIPAAPPPAVQRTFVPGSEWLYARLYTGTANADQVLHEVVQPVVAAAQASGAVDGWFFIRYGDSDWHLRLRLHGPPGRLAAEALPLLHQAAAPLLADGRIWRLELGTYEREVERYGGPAGIQLAERLFQADSEAVVAILATLSGDQGADARWRLALCGIDRLLTDLGLDLSGKRAVIAKVRQGFGREFRVAVPFERQLGQRYRKEQSRLTALLGALDGNADAEEPLLPGLLALRRRSAQIAPIAVELRRLSLPVPTLAESYVHMHANRMLRSAARAQELVLYDFLQRLYQSQAARSGMQTAVPTTPLPREVP